MKIEDIEGASVFVGRPISRLRARAGESVIATVAVLGLSAIHDGGVDPGGFEQVSVSTEVPAGSLSQEGDVVIALTRPWSCGLVGADATGAVVPNSCAVIRLGDKGRAHYDPSFIAGWLGLPAVIDHLKAQSVGVSVPRLSVRSLGAVEMPDVSPDRQRALSRLVTAHTKASVARSRMGEAETRLIEAAYADVIEGAAAEGGAAQGRREGERDAT